MNSSTFAALTVIVSVFFALESKADISFTAMLTGDQVVGGGTTEPGEFGVATFELNQQMTELSYAVQLFGLDLDPIMANRIDDNDVDKIHLHHAPAGVVGPHVLNIFGLPSEDDADLVVDFDNESFSGIWDDGDATGDPNSPGSTKMLSNFVDELLNDEIYLAVHTIGVNGNVAIRGQLIRQVPEPNCLLLLGGLVGYSVMRRQRI